MFLILTIIFFAFGLVIGSFLNVVIYRLNTEKTLGGRSACMSCRTQLSWYEMIPVLSYVGLGGKCKSCASRISIQYPIVELLSGILFTLIFLKFSEWFFVDPLNFSLGFGYHAILFSILLVITVYDLKHKIIPDALSLVFGLMAFVGMFLFLDGGFYPHIPNISQFLAGAAVSVPFALIWLASRGRWMGLGDAKLLVGLGFLLGMSGILSATIIAFWLGAIIGIILLATSKKYSRKSEVPFAPFLILGTILVYFFNLYLPFL